MVHVAVCGLYFVCLLSCCQKMNTKGSRGAVGFVFECNSSHSFDTLLKGKKCWLLETDPFFENLPAGQVFWR